jgi:Rrf2 family protein
MKLSKRCEYALRALVDLGVASRLGRPRVGIAELARREGIPVPFLEQILLRLKNEGLLESKRGAGGGYSLARPMRALRMGDVVRLFDRRLAPISCVSRVEYSACSCPDEERCGLHLLMEGVRAAIAGVLDRRTLADVVEEKLRRHRLDGVPLPAGVDPT